VFRIGDLRDDNFLLGTQISAKIMRRRITSEGEILQEMQMMKIDPDTSSEPAIFFVWPLEIVHVIDEESPLYDMSAADMAKEKFEIVVIMEGTIETSSMTFQARTSYLPSEILWGHRFESMCLYRKDQNRFQVNFSAFHSTYEVETPLCSARDLENFFSNRDMASRYSRPKASMISRGIPHTSGPTVTDLQFSQNNDTGIETSSKSGSLPRQFPESTHESRLVGGGESVFPLKSHLAQIVKKEGSLSSQRDRNESESSTDSSVENRKRRKSKQQQLS